MSTRRAPQSAGPYVLTLHEVDRTRLDLVGGKGTNLGELTRLAGVQVPPGFCVTTHAFRRIITGPIQARLDELARLSASDAGVSSLSEDIRAAIASTPIPDDVAAAIEGALEALGESSACAVRSSATAEDSPSASFAGQQDTYLNIHGLPSVLAHVRRCWASLFTERAVAYRLRRGLDPRKVSMAVVVQRMVFPQVSGVLFTADPITGNRKVAAIEAIFGLGEPLVSGHAKADVYEVRGEEVVAKTIAVKSVAVVAAAAEGTEPQEIERERRARPALTNDRALRIARLGRHIAAHFGTHQDIEWCSTGDDIYVVQSRPITTLFPVPAASDATPHVYISVGHQQMMTNAIKPLGISFFQLTAGRPMLEAGGRLFVDVTATLAAPHSRAGLLELMGRSDPLMRDALDTLLARGDFIPPAPETPASPPPPPAPPAPIDTDASIVTALIQRSQASLVALQEQIRTKAGAELIDFILADLQELKRSLFDPQSHQALMAAFEATWWLNEHLEAWLGEKSATDVLTQSVPHNVTSQMGLELLDVADVLRAHPEVVSFLRHAEHHDFLERLPERAGGREAQEAIRGYLHKYGMRCAGEIDITTPRWSERPGSLLPLLSSHIESFEPGEGARRFDRGLQAAQQKRAEIVQRLRALPDGDSKAKQVEAMIDRVRTFAGYREYPKYAMVSRYFLYKQALMREAARLVASQVIDVNDDIFYLSLPELHDVVRNGVADRGLIRERREAFAWHQTLAPPRVITSDGEIFAGRYRRQGLPDGALVGLAVSVGTVEGRARVVTRMAEADLEPGDILVTTFTDPSWTPVFVTIRGLVTEVGGLMTHGAVIAREYGLPAVVGVDRATTRIRDGQRIRVHGSEGYVEILS